MYYANGQIKQETIYFTLDFLCVKNYYPSGRIKHIRYVLNGQSHGKNISYSPNGEITTYIIANRGVEKYCKLFIENENRIIEKINKDNEGMQLLYVDDKLVEKKYWYNRKFPDTIFIDIYDKTKTFKSEVSNLQRIVKVITHYKNDKIVEVIKMTRNTIREHISYYDNGQLEFDKKFSKRNKELQGHYKEYNEAGGVRSEYSIGNNGNYIGKCYIYDRRRNKLLDMEYNEKGYPIDGEKCEYSEEGILIEQKIYKDGNLKLSKTYNVYGSFYAIEEQFNLVVKGSRTDIYGNLIDCCFVIKTFMTNQVHSSSELSIKKCEELDGSICCHCMEDDLKELFDNGLRICKMNFYNLSKNCPFYLEHISKITNGNYGILKDEKST